MFARAFTGVLLATGLAAAAPAQAQVIAADVIIGGGPVSGRVVIGDPYPRHAEIYRHQPRRVVVVRHAPRVIVVHRVHHRGWRERHYQRHGYRSIRVYWDQRHGRFFDSYRPGLREVSVYERNGQYYRDWDDWGRDSRRDDRREDRNWDD
ncbi:MAG: hypothetical protein AB7I33_13115 [Gemmatimonadales bacterium]